MMNLRVREVAKTRKQLNISLEKKNSMLPLKNFISPIVIFHLSAFYNFLTSTLYIHNHYIRILSKNHKTPSLLHITPFPADLIPP